MPNKGAGSPPNEPALFLYPLTKGNSRSEKYIKTPAGMKQKGSGGCAAGFPSPPFAPRAQLESQLPVAFSHKSVKL